MTLGKTRRLSPRFKKDLGWEGKNMAYWTYRSFDNPLKEGESLCSGSKIWICYEERGYYRETLTNLGGVLGVISYSNSVPSCKYCSDEEKGKNILAIRQQMTQMQWSDEYVLAAIRLFRDKDCEELISELPDLSKRCDYSFHINDLVKLNLSQEFSINWGGGIVNGSFWLEDIKGNIFVSCYVNFRSNSLSWEREDQATVLKYLRRNGGRFLDVYIGEK